MQRRPDGTRVHERGIEPADISAPGIASNPGHSASQGNPSRGLPPFLRISQVTGQPDAAAALQPSADYHHPMTDDRPMTPDEAERAHLRGPEGAPDQGHRRMQELRKIGRAYPFICPVDFKPHRGSPPGSDPNLDPTFVANHREDDGDHYLD